MTKTGRAVVAAALLAAGCNRPAPDDKKSGDTTLKVFPTDRRAAATESDRKDAARVQIRTIENACKLFKLKYGAYPQSLLDLIDPPQLDGAAAQLPFLADPEAIKDPWGQHYAYEPPEGDTSQGGETCPRIWTQAPDGEVIQNRGP